MLEMKPRTSGMPSKQSGIELDSKLQIGIQNTLILLKQEVGWWKERLNLAISALKGWWLKEKQLIKLERKIKCLWSVRSSMEYLYHIHRTKTQGWGWNGCKSSGCDRPEWNNVFWTQHDYCAHKLTDALVNDHSYHSSMEGRGPWVLSSAWEATYR